MHKNFQKWLQLRYAPKVVVTRVSNVTRIEEAYGDLAAIYQDPRFDEIIDELTYSIVDERQNRPNPSKIPIDGNIRNGLATLKAALVLYESFLKDDSTEKLEGNSAEVGSDLAVSKVELIKEADVQKLSLERDMQIALRRDIAKLGQTLTIIDNDSERAVDSGLIDITCEDTVDRAIVVVELKAGRAQSSSVGQILGYMGDLAAEEEGRLVRGILVAHEFERRVIAAARAVPNLTLIRYSVEFRFEPES